MQSLPTHSAHLQHVPVALSQLTSSPEALRQQIIQTKGRPKGVGMNGFPWVQLNFISWVVSTLPPSPCSTMEDGEHHSEMGTTAFVQTFPLVVA